MRRRENPKANTAMTVALKFVRPFGPFNQMNEVDLPDFAVLTGLNGSGKTQLLRALETGTVEASISGTKVDPKEILYVGPQLVPDLQLKYQRFQADSEEASLLQFLGKSSGLRIHIIVSEPEKCVARIGEILGKPVSDLLVEEVRAFAVAVVAEGKTARFSTNLAHVSMGHLRKYYYWLRATFAQQMNDQSLNALAATIGDLRTKPPPWELVSQVISPFGFRIEGPELNIASAQADLTLKFRNKSGEEVSPEQLSGGEQVLLALAIAQYATSVSSTGFAKLLLLDESLSSLHPSIIRQALATIKRVFVCENSIRVMLVTHDATLVALAPPGAIYEVCKESSTLLVREISVDVGIGLLTTGIPAMRVDPQNRRQVILEAKQDEFLYEHAYQALRSRLNPEVSLEFLSCSRQEGTSSKVLDLVPRLRNAGVPTVCGIVDWDGQSRTLPDGVFVLAENERYAVENVFLDPLILAFILARSEEGRNVIGVTSKALAEFGETQLQGVADKIVDLIALDCASVHTNDKTPADVNYVGGHCLRLPAWVLKTRGHEYADCVLAAFPFLQMYHAGPNNSAADRLIAAIGRDHLVDAVDFIPLPLLTLFKQLQRAPTGGVAQ